MQIRRAKLDDIIDIVKLEHTVFQESLGETFLYDELSLNPFARIYIIEDEDGFAGFIGVRVDDQAEMMNFAVIKEKQHRGYGTRLLQHVLNELRLEGINQLSLEVRKSNMIAQTFYEKMGFVKSHIRKDYYKTEDAIVYIKEVTS
jgi:ribosomal-protein-alanine N-acetyltransferase